MAFLWHVNYPSIAIGKVREYLESQYSNMDDTIDCEQILALTSAAGVNDLPQVIEYNARRQAEANFLLRTLSRVSCATTRYTAYQSLLLFPM